MKTKYCTDQCQENLHTAVCLYQRRDAGEFDSKPISPIEVLPGGNWLVDGEEINDTVPSLLLESLRVKLNEVIERLKKERIQDS